MTINSRLIRIPVIVGTLIAAAAVAPTLLHAIRMDQLATSCWQPEAQSSFEELAIGSVQDHLTAHPGAPPGESLAISPAQVSVTTSDFRTISVDDNAGYAHCAALAYFTARRPDGKVLQGKGTVVEFEAHPSEYGRSPSIGPKEMFRGAIDRASASEEGAKVVP